MCLLEPDILALVLFLHVPILSWFLRGCDPVLITFVDDPARACRIGSNGQGMFVEDYQIYN